VRIRKTINVSKTDIKKGVAGACSSCPVALAISRVLGRPVRVSIGGNPSHYFRFDDSESMTPKFPLPPKVRKFIDAFDQGEPVEPFGFTLFYTEAAA